MASLRMASDNHANMRAPSTTWEWRKVKIQRRRNGPSKTAPKAATSRSGGRNMAVPLTIMLTYRGGAEAWWEVKARGRTYHFPGHLCLHDVVARIEGCAR